MRSLPGLLTIFLLLIMGGAAFGQRKATILDHKDRIRITRLDILNSPFRETNLSVTPDGRFLYFMSVRGGQEWSQSYTTYKGKPIFDGDLWFSEKVNGNWKKPTCLPLGINTNSGEDEPNISPDGRTVYYQSWNFFWEFNGGPYYEAKLNESTWGKPKGLGGGVTQFFSTEDILATDGMCVSPDGNMFIVAAGPDYDKDMDIYYSKKTRFGWTYCKKLSISTNGDERSAFLAADGKTLYFASDGYQGFGGLDIFKTVLNEDGTFGEVINVGEPFNTPADDYGFILTGDGNEAYFIRNGDIFFADLTDADDRIKPKVTIRLSGTVKDENTLEPLMAQVFLIDTKTKKVQEKFMTDAAGAYRIELPNEDREYEQVVVSEGYPKGKRNLKLVHTPYEHSYESHFLLGKEENPPLASVEKPKPEDPSEKPILKPEPKPGEKPVVNPPPKPEEKPVINPGPKPEPPVVIAPTPLPTPKPPVDKPVPNPTVEKPELPDPYSFDGVADNNLILLLDVSSSMDSPGKLPLLKESVKKIVAHMRPGDKISVVTFSGDVRVALDGVSASQVAEINSALDKIKSHGSTKSKPALEKAYALAEDHFIKGGNNRIILATDGYFDIYQLFGLADQNAARGIVLSIFSFGKLKEYREEKLINLADTGNGNYSNITFENVDQMLLQEAKAVLRGGKK